MFSKSKFQKITTTLFIIWAFLVSSLPVKAQNVVTSFDLSGGSSAIVLRGSLGAKKKTFVATKRRSRAKRSVKQRRTTRRKVVRQSRRVAKKSRVRRQIKKITPKELEKINWRVMEADKASKILAGAGEYFVEKGESLKAAEYLEEAIQLDANNNDAKIALSEVYATLGNDALEKDNFSKAEKDFTAAIKYDAKNAAAYAGLGQVFDEKDDDEKAKINYEKALEIDPTFAQVYGPLGIIYYKEKQYDKAKEFINKALTDDKDNPESLYFLGVLRYLSFDNEAALDALQKSIKLDDENEEAHYYLGATLDRLNRDKEAIASYERATELDPRYVNAWFDLGIAYYNQDRYQDAINAFDKSISLNTNQTEELRTIYTDSYESRGDAYSKLADKAQEINSKKMNLDKATGDYNIASYQRKDDVEFLSKFGLTLSKQADVYQQMNLQTSSWKRSIDFFEKAIALKPDAIDYTNMGYAYYRMGSQQMKYSNSSLKAQGRANLEQAKVALQKAISMNPEFEEAPLINLGSTLMLLGEYGEAVDVLKRVAKKKNWNAVNYMLGVSYAEINELKEASKYLNKALKQDENNYAILNKLGDIELKRKDKKALKKVISKLRKLNTDRARTRAENLETRMKFDM